MADNPFNALLNPDKQGTITGFIGGVMGNPTASQAAGAATGAALKELSTLRDQGLSPQQSLLKFLQSPSGQDYFVNAGPEGLKQLTDSLAATTPPAPQLHNVAPGGRLMSTDPTTGSVTELGNNPTTEQQNFSAFASLAKLPPAKIREFAAGQIDPVKNPSEKKQAVENLVTNYGLDPKVGQGILAGTLQVIPVRDQYGYATGDVSIVDIGNGTNVLIKPGQASPSAAPAASSSTAPAGTAGTTPATGAGTGIIPPVNAPSGTTDPTQNKKYFGSKADMVLGGGIVPNILSVTSKATEQLDSGLVIPEGAKAQDREAMLKLARNAILGMADTGLGSNKAVVNSYADLVPSGAASESPHSNVQRFIRLHQNIDGEIAAEEAASVNQSLPQSERVASAKRAQAWKKVLRTLPTMDELDVMNNAILNGTSDAMNVRTGTKAAVEGVTKALGSAKKQAAGVQEDISPTGEMDFSTATPEQLRSVDPRKLNTQQLLKLKARIEQLKAGAKNGKQSR